MQVFKNFLEQSVCAFSWTSKRSDHLFRYPPYIIPCYILPSQIRVFDQFQGPFLFLSSSWFLLLKSVCFFSVQTMKQIFVEIDILIKI